MPIGRTLTRGALSIKNPKWDFVCACGMVKQNGIFQLRRLGMGNGPWEARRVSKA